MKTIIQEASMLLVLCLVGANLALCQQQDTSSYFPLGLWGIWIDAVQAPYKGNTVTWSTEISNWTNINANYLVYWYPDSLEEELMDRTESLGYKLDIARWPAREVHYRIVPDTSLRSWIRDSSTVSLTDTWKSQANHKVDGIIGLFGDRPGFHSYFLAHEADLCKSNNNPRYDPDTLSWPALGYVIDRIAQVDAGRKSYVVQGGSNGLPPFGHPPGGFNITLSEFAQRFPNLGIYQLDDYVFYAWRPKSYLAQQNGLDTLLLDYNSCMNAFRNTKTEWHAVIQSQREYKN